MDYLFLYAWIVINSTQKWKMINDFKNITDKILLWYLGQHLFKRPVTTSCPPKVDDPPETLELECSVLRWPFLVRTASLQFAPIIKLHHNFRQSSFHTGSATGTLHYREIDVSKVALLTIDGFADISRPRLGWLISTVLTYYTAIIDILFVGIVFKLIRTISNKIILLDFSF